MPSNKKFYERNNIICYELHHRNHKRTDEPIVTSNTQDGLLDWVESQQLDFTQLYMDIIAWKQHNTTKVPFTVNKHPIWLTRFFELIKK